MEATEITDLKDSILLYLFDCANWKISLSEIYYDLDLSHINKEDVHNYLEDMVLDKLIASFPISGDRNIYYITEHGRMRLKKRGYTKPSGVKLEKLEQNKFIFS